MDTNEAIALEEKRLQELSLTPKAKMSDEERREYNKLHNRKSRRKTNTTEGMKKLLERGERAETQEQFFQLNRAEESPTQIEDWLAQESVIEDMLNWMQYWQELTPDDECYVSLEGGLDLLNDSIQQHGFIKDFQYQSKVLNEHEPSSIFVWETTAHKDKIWGAVTPYWKDVDRLADLIEESEPTRVWALYGVRIGVPQYHYYKWMQSVKGQGLVKAS
jgi:hypothetical protein